MSIIPKRNMLLILHNNRLIPHDTLKISENNIKTKTGSYALEPSHGISDFKNNRIWYFVNEGENNTFNPTTVKNDLNLFQRATVNYSKLHLSLLKIIRNEDIEKPKKTLEIIKETVYSFNEQEKISSDNIKVTPTTEKSIIENEVAKGLTKTNKISPWTVIAILGCGALIGSIFLTMFGGELTDNRDYQYNENYYQQPDNDTIVITMISLDLNEISSQINFNNVISALELITLKNLISLGIIYDSLKGILFP